MLLFWCRLEARAMILLLLVILLVLLLAAAWTRIFALLGWSQWWGLTMIIPVVATTVLFFNPWPIERRLEELQQELDRLRLR